MKGKVICAKSSHLECWADTTCSMATHPEPLLPEHQARSDHVALLRASSLDNVVSLQKECLRGVELPCLLRDRARLFADGGSAARQDPSGCYALSRPVEALDFFISHSVRSGLACHGRCAMSPSHPRGGIAHSGLRRGCSSGSRCCFTSTFAQRPFG